LEMVAKIGESHLDFTERTFVDESVVLVKILIQNNRGVEALDVAKLLKEYVDGKEISKKLSKALDAVMGSQL